MCVLLPHFKLFFNHEVWLLNDEISLKRYGVDGTVVSPCRLLQSHFIRN